MTSESPENPDSSTTPRAPTSAPGTSAAQTPARIAIVGTGGIAESHARALSALADEWADGPDAPPQLVACVDPVAERREEFAEQWDVPVRAASLTELLEDAEIDVVHLCTPPSTHAPLALEAIGAGVNVLCEKPSAMSLAEMDRIIALEATGTARFSTVYQHRFGAGGRLLIELATAGRLGAPRTATCETLWHRAPAYFDPPWRGRWGTEGGGPTLGHGIHQIDLLAAVFGPFRRISATAKRMALPTNTEDVSAAIVEFESGAVATIINSLLSLRESSRLRFGFEQADVEVEHLYGYVDADWRFTPLPEGATERLWELEGEDEVSSHLAQIRAYYRALAHGEDLPVDSASARETLLLVTALYQSAFTGGWVEREDVDERSPFHAALDGGGAAPWPDVKEGH